MKSIAFMLIPIASVAGTLPPTPFPVFLKAGFSSILEFDETPVRVVIGDGQSFQVEKVDHSLVLRTLANNAESNMFVYFRNSGPRLFVLTASDEAVPTYYQKFEKNLVHPNAQSVATPQRYSIQAKGKDGFSARLERVSFDSKKDYLTIEGELVSTSKDVMKPNWKTIHLSSGGKPINPNKLWAERQEVQKDSKIKFRLIFAKPNVQKNLSGVSLVIPIQGANSITVPFQGGKKR